MKKYLRGKASDYKSADIWSAPGYGVTQEEWNQRIGGSFEPYYERRDREQIERKKNDEMQRMSGVSQAQ